MQFVESPPQWHINGHSTHKTRYFQHPPEIYVDYSLQCVVGLECFYIKPIFLLSLVQDKYDTITNCT